MFQSDDNSCYNPNQMMKNKVVLKRKQITIYQVISVVKNKDSALKIKTSSNFLKREKINVLYWNCDNSTFVIHMAGKKC